MIQNNELIQKKIFAIQVKLKNVVNPIRYDDNFMLQQFVSTLHDKVRQRQQSTEACISRTQSSIEFHKKITERLEKA
jgi:hypothetical protein